MWKYRREPKTWASLVLLLFLGLPVLSQPPAMVPPSLQREPRNPDEAAYRDQQIRDSIENQSRQALRDAERQARESFRLRADKPLEMTKEEVRQRAALLAPHPDVLTLYKDFLKKPGTGIFKLYPDSDCTVGKVVKVNGPCSAHVPDASTASFRRRSPTPDIHFNFGQLFGAGFFSQQLIVGLGDVAVDRLSLDSNGIVYLAGVKPASSVVEAAERYREVQRGIQFDNYLYSDRQAVTLDHSYALRVIAYRNDDTRRMYFGPRREQSKDFIKFAQLMEGDRRDILVVFRIVRQETDGSITIVWRELAQKKSPKLEFGKHEEMVDFRTAP